MSNVLSTTPNPWLHASMPHWWKCPSRHAITLSLFNHARCHSRHKILPTKNEKSGNVHIEFLHCQRFQGSPCLMASSSKASERLTSTACEKQIGVERAVFVQHLGTSRRFCALLSFAGLPTRCKSSPDRSKRA